MALPAVAFGPPPLAAQEGCVFGDEGNDVYDQRTLSGGATITYVTNPHFVCADGVSIWADSAVAYSAQGLSHLIGSVRYVDATREMRSDEARYFSQQERVQAQGHVYVRDTGDGSVIENGDLVYLRQADFREEESMTVTTGADGSRPVARIPPGARDSLDLAAAGEGGSPPRQSAPYVVVADWIFLQGSDRFQAAGDVEIERDSLLAYADSADYDRAADRVLLRGSARVEGPTYDLRGRTIDLLTPDGATSEVHAVRDAVLTGDDLVITSSQIRLYLTDGALDRLVATPLPEDTAATRMAGGEAAADTVARATQPVALVDEFQLTADSIDILAPGERIERVFAAGTARSVSHARDSLNVPDLPPIASADWLEGDTVIVYFEPEPSRSTDAAPGPRGAPEMVATSDTAGDRYRVDRIRAMIGARSLYRLASADSAGRAGVDPPALHYVVGDSITIVMNGDEVETMEVIGQTQGVHLEPLSRGALSADSLADTAAVTDTTGAVDPTGIIPPGVALPPSSRNDTAMPGRVPEGAIGRRDPPARHAQQAWHAQPARQPGPPAAAVRGRPLETWRRP